jgi:hypothetical protein
MNRTFCKARAYGGFLAAVARGASHHDSKRGRPVYFAFRLSAHSFFILSLTAFRAAADIFFVRLRT